MLIQERIQLILKMHHLSPSAFADKIGVQRSNISHVLSGRNKPGLDFLEKILIHFPRVNAHWLITGKTEEPLKQEAQQTPRMETGSSHSEALNSNHRKAKKVIIIFDDGSFEEYGSSSE